MTNHLGELLIKEKLISPDQLQKAMESQKSQGGRLGANLTKLGFIKESELTSFISKKFGVPAINLSEFEISPEIISLVTKEVCLRHTIIPVNRAGSTLIVATADPSNIFAIDDIKFLTGYNVETAVASEESIKKAIEKYHDVQADVGVEMAGIMDELEGARNYWYSTGGNCIYDDIIKRELEDKERIVLETDGFVALCPYAARFPFEVWILPKTHDPIFEDVGDDEKAKLAYILKWVLKTMYKRLGNPPYNYYIHTAPSDRNDYRFYHWHLEIMPRLSQAAGFERGTGFYINSVTPEDAARLLRMGPEG